MLYPRSLLSFSLKPKRSSKSVPQSGPRLAIGRLNTRNVLPLFQAPLCSWQEFRSKQGRTRHVHQCETQASSLLHQAKEHGSPPRRTLSPLVLLAKVRLGCEPDIFPSSPTCKCAIKCTPFVNNMVPLPTLPCPRNSFMRDNSPSATCEIRERSPAPAAKQMSRAACGSTHTHTHCPHTHVASPLAARNTLSAGNTFCANSLSQPLSGLVPRPTLPFVFFTVVITKSGDVHGQEQQGV